MTSFPLKIVTADGLIFDSVAEKLIVRTVTGDMAVLARHINCVSPLGMGRAIVEVNGERKSAACIGGMLNVKDGEVTLVPVTFEWAKDIDVARAQKAAKNAEALLEKRDQLTKQEVSIAEARLKRALIRLSVSKGE